MLRIELDALKGAFDQLQKVNADLISRDAARSKQLDDLITRDEIRSKATDALQTHVELLIQERTERNELTIIGEAVYAVDVQANRVTALEEEKLIDCVRPFETKNHSVYDESCFHRVCAECIRGSVQHTK